MKSKIVLGIGIVLLLIGGGALFTVAHHIVVVLRGGAAVAHQNFIFDLEVDLVLAVIFGGIGSVLMSRQMSKNKVRVLVGIVATILVVLGLIAGSVA